MRRNTTKKPSRRLLKLFVGFFIFFVILLIMNGGDVNIVLGLIALATICTVGVGGVVIMIISYIIGSMAIFIFDRLFNKKQPDETFFNRKENASSAIRDYANMARKMGIASKEIEENLLKAGWSADTIKQAMNESNDLPNNILPRDF